MAADSSGIVLEMPKTFGTFPSSDEMFGYFINPEWHRFCSENQHLVQHDVMARHLFTSKAPHFADIRDSSTIPGGPVNAKEREFIDLAIDFGLHQSIAVSFLDAPAGRLSIMMVNCGADGPGDLGELASRHLAEVHLAARYLVEGLHICEFAQDEPRARLSPRERDCLQWATVGRSSKEIAGLMRLADDTVDEYFASAKRKLCASNRTQAVVRARALGLIAP